MWLIDLILNFAGLLLWLKWREGRAAQAPEARISVLANLRKITASSSSTNWLWILLGLLAIRGIVYWQLGSALNWTPRIVFGIIALPFRSDHFARIFLYSFLSFGVVLTLFYLTLLLLTFFKTETASRSRAASFIFPILLLAALGFLAQELVRAAFKGQFVFTLRYFFSIFIAFGEELSLFAAGLFVLALIDPEIVPTARNYLGRFSHFPVVLKLLLPWLFFCVIWCVLHPVLYWAGILPAATSFKHLLAESAVVSLGIFLVWKYIIAALLLLYVLNSYIYFGTWPFWKFIEMTGRNISELFLKLPLRVGKLEFTPLVIIALIILLGEYATRGLLWLYQHLPL